jgi:hypothetical protein
MIETRIIDRTGKRKLKVTARQAELQEAARQVTENFKGAAVHFRDKDCALRTGRFIEAIVRQRRVVAVVRAGGGRYLVDPEKILRIGKILS